MTVYEKILKSVKITSDIFSKMVIDLGTKNKHTYEFSAEEIKAMIVTLKFALQIIDASKNKADATDNDDFIICKN